MKAPTKAFAKSLASQSQGAGKPESIEVQKLRSGGPTMTVPGEGKVEMPPEAMKQNGAGRAERLASRFCEPMSRFGGS
jgi:hypothetical protein